MLMLKLPLLWLDNVVVAIASGCLLFVACFFYSKLPVLNLHDAATVVLSGCQWQPSLLVIIAFK